MSRASLAPLIVQDITRAVAELAARGLTVLLVERNARAALKISTHGYVLEMGRFVAEGDAERLMNDERLAATHLRYSGAEVHIGSSLRRQNEVSSCIRAPAIFELGTSEANHPTATPLIGVTVCLESKARARAMPAISSAKSDARMTRPMVRKPCIWSLMCTSVTGTSLSSSLRA